MHRALWAAVVRVSSDDAAEPAARVRILRATPLQRIVALPVLCSIALGCVTTLPAEPGDSEIVVTAARLGELGLELPADHQSFETLQRERIAGGVTNIEYEFAMPDEGPPYILSLAELHPTARSACSSFSAGNLGIRLSGLEVEEHDDMFRYGEQSRFAIIATEGMPAGNLFAMCNGRTTYLLMFVGIYFVDPEVWRDFITPHLEALSALDRARP